MNWSNTTAAESWNIIVGNADTVAILTNAISDTASSEMKQK